MIKHGYARGRHRHVATALQELSRAQKPAHGTGAYSRFVNRPLGRRLAAWAYVLRLTPNQVSGLSALCSLGAVVLLALGPASWWLGAAVATLLVTGYALDSADGQVARLTGSGSVLGEWLDHMIDCAKLTCLHVATAVYLYRATDLPKTAVLAALAFLVVDNLFFFGMILTDQLRRAHDVRPVAAGSSLSVTRSLLMLPQDFGALCLVYLLLGWPAAFLTGYVALAVGELLLLVAALTRWARQLKAVGAPAVTA